MLAKRIMTPRRIGIIHIRQPLCCGLAGLLRLLVEVFFRRTGFVRCLDLTLYPVLLLFKRFFRQMSAGCYILPGNLPKIRKSSRLFNFRYLKGKFDREMTQILLINGPNLNLLGQREPEIYGTATLGSIESSVRERVEQAGLVFACVQSNSEGALVDWVQQHCNAGDGVILNAGALTHTSIALRDALLAREVVLVEVHISNIYKREPFRHHSYFTDIAAGIIAGLGTSGYEYAVEFLLKTRN